MPVNREEAMYGNGRPMRGVPQGRMMANARGAERVMERNAEYPDIPAGNEKQLLIYIDEVSFCAYDLMLYLDTHPTDENALEYFRRYNSKRERALDIYEEKYGPLRYGQTGRCKEGSIKWVAQKWPWEGGVC